MPDFLPALLLFVVSLYLLGPLQLSPRWQAGWALVIALVGFPALQVLATDTVSAITRSWLLVPLLLLLSAAGGFLLGCYLTSRRQGLF